MKLRSMSGNLEKCVLETSTPIQADTTFEEEEAEKERPRAAATTTIMRNKPMEEDNDSNKKKKKSKPVIHDVMPPEVSEAVMLKLKQIVTTFEDELPPMDELKRIAKEVGGCTAKQVRRKFFNTRYKNE